MMELIRDPELFHAIKMEVSTAARPTQDPRAQEEPFDTQKLLQLPLLQSVFIEAMRLHVSVLITRTCIEDVNLAGYTIPEGSIVQTPTEASHLDEDVCESVFTFHVPRITRTTTIGLTTQPP